MRFGKTIPLKQGTQIRADVYAIPSQWKCFVKDASVKGVVRVMEASDKEKQSKVGG